MTKRAGIYTRERENDAERHSNGFMYHSPRRMGVLTIRTSNKNRADDFSMRSNIRAVRDFLIMKYRLEDYQIVNISILMRRRYPRVYDFCRNMRKSSAAKTGQAKVVILF